jgi:citrate synthase
MHRNVNAEDGRRRRQINDVEYVNSAEAIAILGVRRETLYTYVSRGFIKTMRPSGSKAKLYRKTDVEKLKSRAVARSGGPQVSHALRYGEPIAQTWISEITAQGPRYRGVLARDLVRDGRSFEFVSELIWTGVSRSRDVAWPALPESRWLEVRIKAALQAAEPVTPLKLLSMLTTSLSAFERADEDFQSAGVAASRRLLQALAGSSGAFGPKRRFMPPLEGEFIAQCLARGLGLGGRTEAVRALDAALVLSAEHELSAPTFAARICASTGADLHACVATAMLTQSGAMQVGGAVEVEALIDALPEHLEPDDALVLAAASGFKGNELPCFTHPLYDGEDPRSAVLLEIAGRLSAPGPDLPKMLALVQGARQAGQHPNVFAALVILCKAMALPNGIGALLHTLARTTGWIAHAMEQRLTGAMLRPRAKYMGNPVAR